MNHYWFLHRCLRCKAQSSFFWGDKLLNHFSRLLICYRDPGTPIIRSFRLTPGLEWITQNDELGFASDPHPGTGACRHLHVVLNSSLKTPDYDWTDGCIHRLVDVKACIIGQTPDLTQTDTADRVQCNVLLHMTEKCVGSVTCAYLVLLDDAVLLVGGRGVPWYTDGCAVMAPHRQHRHLLWWCTRSWWFKVGISVS